MKFDTIIWALNLPDTRRSNNVPSFNTKTPI